MDWKALFGDAEHITLAELEDKLAGKKLVDLSEGGYVAKEKFDAEVKKHKDAAATATKELTDLKAATDGDEGLKQQIATLTKERDDLAGKLDKAASDLTAAQRKALVDAKGAHLSDKLRRSLMQDAEALVADDLDFEAALAKAMTDDPDYAPPAKSDEDDKPATRMSLGDQIKGAGGKVDPDVAAFAESMGVDLEEVK